MKKISFSQKLAAYSVLSTSFVIAEQGDAQIKYTDISPDHLISAYNDAGLYYMDLNADGKADVKISVISFTGSEFYDVKYRAYPASSVELVQGEHGAFISALPSSFPVKLVLPNKLKWNQHHDLGIHYFDVWGTDDYAGPWIEERGVQRYIGFLIHKKGANYYGWIRCMIWAHEGHGHSMIFYDYAINLTPNAPIKTGQVYDNGTMLRDKDAVDALNNPTQPSVFTLDKSIHINLNDEEFLNSMLSIFNLNGQLIHSQKITQLNFSVELPQLPDGIYILNLNNGSKRKSYKIYL